MGVSLERVQFKFASIVGELCSEPDVLSQFAVWLDLRLAEYKLKGAISLDCSGEEPDPTWLKGLSKQKSAAVNSQTDRRTQSHSPAISRNTSLHRSALSSSVSDIPIPQSHSVPSAELAERLSPDIVVFKEEPQEVFPVALHENAGGVPSSGHKRSAAESSMGSHWSKSSSPTQSKIRRLSSKESCSNQSLMTVIGDYSVSDQELQESDAMGDNSVSVPSSSGFNISAACSKSADLSTDQSTDLSDSALSNDQFLQEMRWSGHHSASEEAGPSNSNVLPWPANQRTLAQANQTCLSGEMLMESRRQENQTRKLRISSERLALIPRQTVTSMAAAVGTFERWLWSTYPDEVRTITDIPPGELDGYLAGFLRTVVTPSGADYKPRSFVMLRSCLGRYLKETNYPETILNSPLFTKSQEAYQARKREIVYRESLMMSEADRT